MTGEEVAGFRNQDFWHPDTPMYFDDDLAFFRAFGNGKLRKGSNAGLVGALLNPFSAVYKTYGKTSDAIKENADLVGEGKIMGGLFVISKNGVEYAHKEKHYGTVAPVDEVLAAVESAAADAIARGDGTSRGGPWRDRGCRRRTTKDSSS